MYMSGRGGGILAIREVSYERCWVELININWLLAVRLIIAYVQIPLPFGMPESVGESDSHICDNDVINY